MRAFIDCLTSDAYQILLSRREIAKSAGISPEEIKLYRQKILLFCNLPLTRQEFMFLTIVNSKKTFSVSIFTLYWNLVI